MADRLGGRRGLGAARVGNVSESWLRSGVSEWVSMFTPGDIGGLGLSACLFDGCSLPVLDRMCVDVLSQVGISYYFV